MNDTGAAILAAIIANPEEDTPRLVYADWLQENGDDDRAEFIRVQVLLPLLPLCGGADVISAGHCTTCRNVVEMRRRARELLAANRDRWMRVTCPKCGGKGHQLLKAYPNERGADSVRASCPECDGSGDIGGLTESVHLTTFARGLLDCVEGCRLADVFERAFVSRPDDSTKMYWAGAWVPTAWILRVFAHHPTITRVPLLDSRPIQNQVDIDRRSGWTWFVGDASFAHSAIHVTNDLWRKMPTTWYATEATANDALARAVADVVRAASNQPQE